MLIYSGILCIFLLFFHLYHISGYLVHIYQLLQIIYYYNSDSILSDRLIMYGCYITIFKYNN